jgi:hypothetical protein
MSPSTALARINMSARPFLPAARRRSGSKQVNRKSGTPDAIGAGGVALPDCDNMKD